MHLLRITACRYQMFNCRASQILCCKSHMLESHCRLYLFTFNALKYFEIVLMKSKVNTHLKKKSNLTCIETEN